MARPRSRFVVYAALAGERLHVLGVARQAAFLDNFRRCQSGILSTTLPWSCRDAAARCRLTGYLRWLELRLINWCAYVSPMGLIVFCIGLAYALIRKENAANNLWGAGATTLEWTLSS
jgi:hypothetical protein